MPGPVSSNPPVCLVRVLGLAVAAYTGNGPRSFLEVEK